MIYLIINDVNNIIRTERLLYSISIKLMQYYLFNFLKILHVFRGYFDTTVNVSILIMYHVFSDIIIFYNINQNNLCNE